MKQPLTISITPGTVLTVLLVLLGAYLVFTLIDLVLLVLTAIVIASALEPGVSFFMRRAHLPRVLSVLAMYIIVFGIIIGAIYYFLPPVLDQAQSFIALLPQYLEIIQLPSSFEEVGLLTQEATTARSTIVDTLVTLRESFADTGEGIIRLLATIFGGILSFILVVVLSFYFAVSETGIDDFLRIVTPKKHQAYVVNLWRRSQRKIGLWMQGQLMLSLIAGVIVYLGLTILGVPYALLLAVFTAFFELIPFFGSFIAAIPAVIIAFTMPDGGLMLALIVVGLYVVMNQFQGNLIYPLVVKKVVGVPPILVILALIVGAQLGGFLGILLSVPIAAGIQELVKDIQKGRNGPEEAEIKA